MVREMGLNYYMDLGQGKIQKSIHLGLGQFLKVGCNSVCEFPSGKSKEGKMIV